MGRRRSWWAGTVVTGLLLALFAMACGPEDTRPRGGGTGGSSRPDAPPSVTSAPELITRPTSNIPYAQDAPLPTLPPLSPAAPGPAGAGNPATPGFGVPTGTAATTLPLTPGGSPLTSPTRGGSPAATPTR